MDSHCPGQICHSANYCQDCEVDDHCPGSQICTNQLECVECEVDSHCPTGEICGLDRTCAECHIDAHCDAGSCVGGSCTTEVVVSHAPIRIEGETLVSRTLNVTGCSTISAIEVVIGITNVQLWSEDLLMELTSPSGASFDFWNVPPGNSFVSGQFVFPTDYTPPQSLAPLVGQGGNGTWGLEILYVGFPNEAADVTWTLRLTC